MSAHELADLAHRHELAASLGDLERLTTAGAVAVVNHFALRDHADYGDDSSEPPATGLEALLRYAAVSAERLAAVGGSFVHQIVAPVTLWGDDWDILVVASYPSGRAVLDLLDDPAYREAYRHRRAAVRRQLVTVGITESAAS